MARNQYEEKKVLSLTLCPYAVFYQYFTLIRVFEYYQLKHNFHYNIIFGIQEVKHNCNTKLSSNNLLNMHAPNL